jgi:hypothetical protein
VEDFLGVRGNIAAIRRKAAVRTVRHASCSAGIFSADDSNKRLYC